MDKTHALYVATHKSPATELVGILYVFRRAKSGQSAPLTPTFLGVSLHLALVTTPALETAGGVHPGVPWLVIAEYYVFPKPELG